LARNLALLTVAVTGESMVTFAANGVQKNRSITLRDLAALWNRQRACRRRTWATALPAGEIRN
jgi:hypothetical protein